MPAEPLLTSIGPPALVPGYDLDDTEPGFVEMSDELEKHRFVEIAIQRPDGVVRDQFSLNGVTPAMEAVRRACGK